MFTVYIDDAGTDPSQKVAIGTGLVIPSSRLVAFQSEWNSFVARENISDFHASECAASNPKSDFAGWEKEKIYRAFKRIREITKKYGVFCVSLCVKKADYDSIVPVEMRPAFGNHHYTFTIHNLLALLDRWGCQSGSKYPMDYVFDWVDPKSQRSQKAEIEDALHRIEKEQPGRFAGHYSFHCRKDYPGLQCVDLVGWACYRYGLKVHAEAPMTDLQCECFDDFSKYRNGKWLLAIGQTQQQIQEAVDAQIQLASDGPLPFMPYIDGQPN